MASVCDCHMILAASAVCIADEVISPPVIRTAATKRTIVTKKI
jgi:hypothetical protein